MRSFFLILKPENQRAGVRPTQACIHPSSRPSVINKIDTIPYPPLPAFRCFEDRAVTTLALVCPSKGEVLPPLRAQHHHHTSTTGAAEGGHEPGAAAAAAVAAAGEGGEPMGFRMLEESVSFAKAVSGKGQLYLAYRKGGPPLGLCEVAFKGGQCTWAWVFDRQGKKILACSQQW